MGLFHRRAPLYGRPLPFLSGALLGALLAVWGLGWQWNWSLQTGNVFLLLILPKSIVPANPLRLLGLLMGVALIVAAWVWGMRSQRAHLAERRDGVQGWRRATFRFYPRTAMFGLFLLLFGAAFVFDASLYGDDAPGGYAAFVYLDYAGLFDRPVATGLGILVLAFGFSCMTTLAFERGDGVQGTYTMAPTPAPAPQPAPAAPPAPAWGGPIGAMPRATRSILQPFTMPGRNLAARAPPPAAVARAPVNSPMRAVGPVPRPTRGTVRTPTRTSKGPPPMGPAPPGERRPWVEEKDDGDE